MDLLEDAYGFAFPGDFVAFRELMLALRSRSMSLETSPLGIAPGPVFGVFEQDLDLTRFDPVAQSRYPLDPPEFFTLLHGDTDGLHWGYWVDDPADPAPVVASYYHADAFAISVAGADLFEAVRMHLEARYRDDLEYLVSDPGNAAEYRRRLGEMDAIRAVLCVYGTGQRGERGADYVDAYPGEREPTISTIDGMGIVVPPHTYRPIPGEGRLADPELGEPTGEVVARIVDAARRALAEGYPATALKVGKDLWPRGAYLAWSCELLDAAYAALKRSKLRHMLMLARAARRAL